MHNGGGMKGRKVDEEDPLHDVHIGVVPGISFVQDPLEHIILLPAYEQQSAGELSEGRTGLSDQSSPNSFMFALLSSSAGLMCGMARESVSFALLSRAPTSLLTGRQILLAYVSFTKRTASRSGGHG